VALAQRDQATVGVEAGTHAGLATAIRDADRKLDVWGNHATKQ
jgi:hypothetical protein